MDGKKEEKKKAVQPEIPKEAGSKLTNVSNEMILAIDTLDAMDQTKEASTI